MTPLHPLQVSSARTHLVNGGNDLEQFVVGQVLERKLPLRHVPRVSFPQHGVSVTGDNLLVSPSSSSRPTQNTAAPETNRPNTGERWVNAVVVSSLSKANRGDMDRWLSQSHRQRFFDTATYKYLEKPYGMTSCGKQSHANTACCKRKQTRHTFILCNSTHKERERERGGGVSD